MSRSPHLTRRAFIGVGTKFGLGGGLAAGLVLSAWPRCLAQSSGPGGIPSPQKGESELFVDDRRVLRMAGVRRKSHAARKLDRPVLEGTKPWEVFVHDGVKIPYVATYGTVLRDPVSGSFRMWYNVHQTTCHAVSDDGLAWNRSPINPRDGSNVIDLFGFHSPSIIHDLREEDPERRFKALGSLEGFDREVIARLKARFKSSGWYRRSHAYAAAYSADGVRWKRYPEPVLMGMDTITMAQDPATGEYLALHKNTQDPRSFGRQIFLSTSRDMQTWSEPELAMATDEEDHREARKLKGGTHAEFYNMSAFRHGGQWLGLVTPFRCTGAPLEGGKARPGQQGVIDVQLVHSRDGRKWERCSDRSPVIPVGPHRYDGGSIFGVCNTPVSVGDEMWVYYSGSTGTHAGGEPDKSVAIGRAAWRVDGMVSLTAERTTGVVDTALFRPPGPRLSVNADVSQGRLAVEVMDDDGRVMPGYDASSCVPLQGAGVRQYVSWRRKGALPEGRPLRLRFLLSNGSLFSYVLT